MSLRFIWWCCCVSLQWLLFNLKSYLTFYVTRIDFKMFHADFNFMLSHLFLKPSKYIFICIVIVFLACTQTLFYSSFLSFWKHRQAHERALLSPPLPPAIAVINFNLPRFFFYHVCSTDFEEKLEGLWTGHSLPSLATHAVSEGKLKFDCVFLVTRYKVKKMSCSRQLTCAQWSRTFFLVEILAK